MKKIISLLLAVASVVSIAACSKDPVTETSTDAVVQPSVGATSSAGWPDDAFFKDIPAIDGDIISSQGPSKDDNGYVYSFLVYNVDYQGLKDYVKQLETAGFSIYKSNPLDTIKTEDKLPETLDEGQDTASWFGKRRGTYVSIIWHAEKSGSEQGNRLSLFFYTYDAFAEIQNKEPKQ